MTAGALLGELRRRGVLLWGEGTRLRWRAPRGMFTDSDRAIVTAHKSGLLTVLTAEGVTAVPGAACGFCGTTSWTWTPDWPVSGAGVWFCATCCSRATPTLIELAATLTPEEHRRLRAEVAAGDALAIQVLGALMLVTCPSCGGDRWRADGPDGERCVDCGAWSPCSRPHDAGGTAAR
jgi:hypothetical protein